MKYFFPWQFVIRPKAGIGYGRVGVVRCAVEGDIPWLAERLQKLSKLFPGKHPLFPGEVSAAAGLPGFIQNHVMLVAECEGEKLGLVGGMETRHPFNQTLRVLCETFWWVDEVEGRSRAGAALMDAFTDYGLIHADWIVFALQESQRVGAGALRRRGYVAKERAYLLEVT
jgi:hypothetical protein